MSLNLDALRYLIFFKESKIFDFSPLLNTNFQTDTSCMFVCYFYRANA